MADNRSALTPGETRVVARREVERQQKRYIGLTASVPALKEINSKLEWVCDVRIGADTDWDVVEDVPIAMLQGGILSDVNIPVTLERSETGQLRIMGRAKVRLPNIHTITYTEDELELLFMKSLTQDGTCWYDGYGYAVADPETTGVTTEKQWVTSLTLLEDFDFDGTVFMQSTSEWRDESDV